MLVREGLDHMHSVLFCNTWPDHTFLLYGRLRSAIVSEVGCGLYRTRFAVAGMKHAPHLIIRLMKLQLVKNGVDGQSRTRSMWLWALAVLAQPD